MKTTLCALALLTSFSALSQVNPTTLSGKYVGRIASTFGLDRSCYLEINEMSGTQIHFKLEHQKSIFSKTTQRLLSISGPRSYYTDQALAGEAIVEKNDQLDRRSSNYGYVLPHHDEADFGHAVISFDETLQATEYVHLRDRLETRCEKLVRLN